LIDAFLLNIIELKDCADIGVYLKVFQQWMADLKGDGLPPGIPLLIAAALDGLTFWNLFGLYAPPDADLQQLRTILENLASNPE
jgi:hypothetical protein